MDLNKPQILIGILGEAGEACHTAAYREIMYGIEEEGCLCAVYYASSAEDIIYSTAGVTIMLTETYSCIYVSELTNGGPLYRISPEQRNTEPENFRRLGKNASRYLKQKKLEI